MLTVERLDDGEVSPYLADELRVGDSSSCAARSAATSSGRSRWAGPLLLIGGGSGVVPLRAMLRHSGRDRPAPVPARLLYSSRSLGRGDLPRRAVGDARRRRRSIVRFALTREWPEDWQRAPRADRPPACSRSRGPPAERPLIYICGPNAFVEAASGWLVEIGHDPGRIRTERFGPTGT